MELLLLKPLEYERLYNCTLYNQGYFDHMKVPNKLIGAFYVISGLTYIMLYIPTIYVMALPKFRRFSCYKIMLFLAVIDSICLSMVCVLYGIFAYRGMVFCNSPTLFYISGGIGTALWNCTCLTVIVLAINRLCDLIDTDWSKALFCKGRTKYWLLIPILDFTLVMWYSRVFLFTSVYYAEFNNPYVGTIFEDLNDLEYLSWATTINDIISPLVMVFLYTIICVLLLVRTCKIKFNENAARLTNFQRSTVIQSCLICCLFVLCGGFYNYMNYFGAPVGLVTLTQIIWQTCHGGPVIIYLIFNRSLRCEFRKLFGNKKNATVTSFNDTGNF